MDQYAGNPGHSTYCYAELTVSFINFLHYCLPPSGLYGAGKDNGGRHTDSPSGMDATASRLSVPLPPSSPGFMPSVLPATTLPIKNISARYIHDICWIYMFNIFTEII